MKFKSCINLPFPQSLTCFKPVKNLNIISTILVIISRIMVKINFIYFKNTSFWSNPSSKVSFCFPNTFQSNIRIIWGRPHIINPKLNHLFHLKLPIIKVILFLCIIRLFNLLGNIFYIYSWVIFHTLVI